MEKSYTPLCPHCGQPVQKIQSDSEEKLYNNDGELHVCEKPEKNGK